MPKASSPTAKVHLELHWVSERDCQAKLKKSRAKTHKPFREFAPETVTAAANARKDKLASPVKARVMASKAVLEPMVKKPKMG